MVTFELTEQDKTDNRWGGVGWIVDSKKSGTVHDGFQNTIHQNIGSGQLDIVEWTSYR